MASTDIKTDTNVQPVKLDASFPAMTGGYCALVLSSTYFYPVLDTNAPLEAIQIEWDSAAILTITVEDTNYNEVTDYENTTKWVQEDPPTAYIGITPKSAATYTNLTVSVAGGTAGTLMLHIGNTGAKRTRLRVVVGGTGGQVRVAKHGKQ